MSYNRQPVAEDPMQIWGAVGVLLILLLFVIWLFLPEVVYASCLILHEPPRVSWRVFYL
uniref:Uncharacterized protein n=1 Tax=Escherichia coli TaxID=562 RepID=A0A3S7MB75_ECOLX|nr:hypothetical protein [Escherichia coli]